MKKTSGDSEELSGKLDEIIHLLQNLFILQATRAGMKKEELRKILAIDKNRIGRISKNIGE